jgi:hypothetical protein
MEPERVCQDEWGCVRSRPLRPGTYTLKGNFKPKAADHPPGLKKRFRIVAA